MTITITIGVTASRIIKAIDLRSCFTIREPAWGTKGGAPSQIIITKIII